MNFRRKKAVIFLSIALVLFLTISFVLGYFNSIKPREVVYPEGHLSESIFESQNTDYVKNESLPNTKTFENIPYSYDVPNVDAANVDFGSIYKLSEEYYYYVTEYGKDKNPDAVIAHELGTVMNMNLDESQSILTHMHEEKGFINGYEAQYRIDSLAVTDGINASKSYLMGYCLVIPDTNENIFVGMVSNRADNYEQMNDLLSACIYTLQYSESKRNELAEKAAIEAKKLEEQQELEEAERMANEQVKQELKAEEEEVQDNTKNMAVQLDKSYDDLQLYIYWTNGTVVPNLTLHSPDNTLTYKPSYAKDGEAYFSVGQAESGTWVLDVVGKDYGEFSMKKEDGYQINADENTDEGTVAEQTDTQAGSTKIVYKDNSGPTANYAIPGQSTYSE